MVVFLLSTEKLFSNPIKMKTSFNSVILIETDLTS